MKMSVTLLSSNDDVDPMKYSVESQVQWPGVLVLENVLSWDEVSKPENGYVNNNSITLEVKIKADKPEGDVPNVDPCNAAKRGRFECSICLECIGGQDISATPCGHIFCTACITTAIKKHGVCPLCKETIFILKHTFFIWNSLLNNFIIVL